MVNYIPRDGSVLIIDDKVEEALPLIEVLSQKGIPFTFYTGVKDSELPEKPVQKIRLAFIDIQLFEFADANTYAQNVLRLLDRLIPDDNGPYILIVWSILENVYAPELKRQVMAPQFNKRPVIFTPLSKTSYFSQVTDESLEDLLEEVHSSLHTVFNDDDLSVIKSVISEKYPVRTPWQAKDNAFELIFDALKAKLEEADTFLLFTIWENLINKASGRIVHDFAALYPSDEYWQDNLKSGIYRMAYAQLGRTIGLVDEGELIRNALYTLNHTFIDVLENELSEIESLSEIIKVDKNIITFKKRLDGAEYKIKWTVDSNRYQIYINDILAPTGSKGYDDIHKLIDHHGRNASEGFNIKTIIECYNSMKPEINSRLLIDFNAPESVQPGNVYIRRVRRMDRRKELLKNYVRKDSKVIDKDGNYLVSDDELKKIVFIELEVTPICDYVQGKRLKARFLSGILIPEAYCEEIKKPAPESFYMQIPILKINNKYYKPVFDFRLLKSHDVEKDASKVGKPLFRLRRELCTDIISRLSSHASRVGITYIE